MIIHCSNPTCASVVALGPHVTDAGDGHGARRALEALGWALELEPPDDWPAPYCPRCKP